LDTYGNYFRSAPDGFEAPQGRTSAAGGGLYQEILQNAPDHPDALHLLGLVRYRTGQHEAAIESISHAVELMPNNALYHSSLGAAYRADGKIDEAVLSYQRALKIKPDYAEAHFNLGIALEKQGKIMRRSPVTSDR